MQKKVVKKKNNTVQDFSTQKIKKRLEVLEGRGNFSSKNISYEEIAMKALSQLPDEVSSIEIDQFLMELVATMSATHPDYSYLASAIAISALHKDLKDLPFSKKTEMLCRDGLLSDEYNSFVQTNKEYLDSLAEYRRDYSFDYFGYTTLKRAYLMKDASGRTLETPQDLALRVAIAVSKYDLGRIPSIYDNMFRTYTHATPTLFNAGTKRQQLSSCFLMQIEDDSIDGIYNTLKNCALISQTAGGIGISITNVRSKGSRINGTGGTSNGLVPMLRNFNETARYVDQGGGKRKGSIAVYLEPWHSDIIDFLDLRKNHGKEEMRARDLFLGLWISDLFMEKVRNDEQWHLFSPSEAVGLDEAYGREFEILYNKYVEQGISRKTVRAQELWERILVSQMETGTPYMLYKDAANKKSNQKNLGALKTSNLCCEILEYVAPDEVAVCNLASIALPAFVDAKKKRYDFASLHRVTKEVAVNLDNVIDINYYPVPQARKSNIRHRPIGIGVQGLADTFALLGIAFDSKEAEVLNKMIFATIYHAAVEQSSETAKEKGSYETFEGSPASKGILQFDMWGVEPLSEAKWGDGEAFLFDWASLKEKVVGDGLRNSLLLAPMPTASTSQIMGYNECFEPFTSNLYTRRVLSGDFIVANRYLIQELSDLGLWNKQMKNRIVAENGSIQNIEEIPSDIRERYKTAYELSQKAIINLAADRGAYICQTQSMNLFVSNPTTGKLTSMHFYAWQKGLKTGVYYLRSKSAVDAIKFTLSEPETSDPSKQSDDNMAGIACSLDNPEGCLMCGS